MHTNTTLRQAVFVGALLIGVWGAILGARSARADDNDYRMSRVLAVTSVASSKEPGVLIVVGRGAERRVVALYARTLGRAWEFPAPSDSPGFGHSLTALDDLDKDGVPEVAIGSYAYPSPEWQPDGVTHGFSFGASLILSGKNGAVITSLSDVNVVRQLSDLNKDGVGELAASRAPMSVGRSQVVTILDGTTRQRIREIMPPAEWGCETFGWSVVEVSDADGDLQRDLVVASPACRSSSGEKLPSRIGVFSSGATRLIGTVGLDLELGGWTMATLLFGEQERLVVGGINDGPILLSLPALQERGRLKHPVAPGRVDAYGSSMSVAASAGKWPVAIIGANESISFDLGLAVLVYADGDTFGSFAILAQDSQRGMDATFVNDVNGDGCPDIVVVRVPRIGAGASTRKLDVEVFSGSDSKLLCTTSL